MHDSSRLLHAALALSVAAIVGCSSSTSAPSNTGSITVTITPADGTTPVVVITGPNAYSNTISTTKTLTGLATGSYTIVADSAIGPDSVVGTITDTGTVTGSPATVTSGSNVPATATYYTKDRVGGMWVANTNYRTIPELASLQLRESGTLVAAETLATDVSGPGGLALDASGNMWESSFLGDSLLMYSIAARNAGGNTAPTTVIVSSALQNANSIAFDPKGNLWVPSCALEQGETASLLEFSAAQQAAGGNVAPAAIINTTEVAACPYAIAFDTKGNAWVADFFYGQVLEYTAAQLAAGSGSPTPAITIDTPAPGGTAVAFDAKGNLWVGNASNTVVEYTPAQQAAGGTPVPNAIVAVPSGAEINGLAIDNRGTLWVADGLNQHMYALTSNQLVSGTPTPSVTILYALAGGVFPQQPLFDKYAVAVAPSASRVRPHPIAPAGAARRLSKHRRYLPNG